jgi:cation diffusion facilitator family transporter
MESINTDIAIKKSQLKKGRNIALLSTVIIFSLSLLKAVVGYQFNSPLLVADAWHSGADILINFTSLAGLWVASKKKSTRFPYGLYRAETIACLVIAGLIILIGLNMFKDGLEKLSKLELQHTFPLFPIGAAVVSCSVACFLTIKQKRVGKAIGSQALMATSRESFFDIFTSLFVLAGILLVYAKIPYVEGAIIMTISVLILKLGLETAITSMMILMDANLDAELQKEIEDKLNRLYGIKGVSHVRIRQSGPFKLVACTIRTKPSLSLYKSHELADKAEALLIRDYPQIESVFIHVEPQKEYVEKAIIPVQTMDGLKSKLHGHFGRAPYFIILKLDGNHLEVEGYYKNEFLDNKGHIGLNVVKSIDKYKIDLLFVESLGEIAFHMLKNNFVDIYKSTKNSCVQDIIDLYRLNRLETLTEPTHSVDQALVMKS